MATTPNMGMELPDVNGSLDTWGTELNTGLGIFDAHNHSPGMGVPVPTAGLNIDTDLSVNEQDLTDVKALVLASQGSGVVSTATSLTVIDNDLWYLNGSATPVQITQGNSITSSSSPLVPPGVIWPYGGISAPTGFLLCNGAAIDRTTFADLFAVLGTTYGVGDGSTTFNIPNMNGRTPIGAGTYTDPVSGSVTRTLGASSGAAAHQLVDAENGAHTHVQNAHAHGITDPGHAHNIVALASPSGGLDVVARIDASASASLGGYVASATTGISINNGTATNQNSGSGTAHNNMQPYVVSNFIIKT